MEESLLHLYRELTKSSLWALVFAAVIVVVAKVVSEAWIDSLRTSRERELLTLQRLKPILAAASDLLSRIGDILVVRYEKRRDLIRRRASLPEPDYAQVTPSSLDRIEMAAYSMLNFLALSKHFQQETADLVSPKSLDRVGYFLSHKIPMILRGNLYGVRFLTSEQQEELAIAFLQSNKEVRPVDLTVEDFCALLRTKQAFLPLVKRILEGFMVDVTPLESDGQIAATENWSRLLILSHLAVYLADFVQEHEHHCQWEELRLLSVRIIKQWNLTSGSPRYLYEQGDMARSYLSTYPIINEPLGILRNLAARVWGFSKVERAFSRSFNALVLSFRGGRYRRRHEPKQVRRWGLKVHREKQWVEFKLSDPLPGLFKRIHGHIVHSW